MTNFTKLIKSKIDNIGTLKTDIKQLEAQISICKHNQETDTVRLLKVELDSLLENMNYEIKGTKRLVKIFAKHTILDKLVDNKLFYNTNLLKKINNFSKVQFCYEKIIIENKLNNRNWTQNFFVIKENQLKLPQNLTYKILSEKEKEGILMIIPNEKKALAVDILDVSKTYYDHGIWHNKTIFNNHNFREGFWNYFDNEYKKTKIKNKNDENIITEYI